MIQKTVRDLAEIFSRVLNITFRLLTLDAWLHLQGTWSLAARWYYRPIAGGWPKGQGQRIRW